MLEVFYLEPSCLQFTWLTESKNNIKEKWYKLNYYFMRIFWERVYKILRNVDDLRDA